MDLSALSIKQEVPLSELERMLVAAIQYGLPLAPRPYALLAAQIGSTEAQVIELIGNLLQRGVIKRLGVVVRHRELGYRANAMVVWDIPDADVSELGRCIGKFEFVTLCYRRPRQLPAWPYNLFCMIHGKDRTSVMEKIRLLEESCALANVPHEVLFSRRRFKQRGAVYAPNTVADAP